MKLYTNEVDYNITIDQSKLIKGEYNKIVLFHFYWNGILNEKHLIAIKSCYYFNIRNKTDRRIILWLENNIPNHYNDEILKYACIKTFNLDEEQKRTFLEHKHYNYNRALSYYSDVVRYVLLYKYGGCWIDLDVLCLKSFDELFINFEQEIMVYQWEEQNYPNGAIYISLLPRSLKMKAIIEFIISRNRGWGFQEADLTYDLPLDMLVLPCSWFDGAWIKNPYNLTFDIFQNTDKIYTFDNFFPGAFAFHWHNKWNVEIGETSIMRQLANKLS